MHDIIDDKPTTRDEPEQDFGPDVAAAVMEVPNNKSQRKAERKHPQIQNALYISDWAKLVEFRDNIPSLRDVHASPLADWPLERRREYFDWAKLAAEETWRH